MGRRRATLIGGAIAIAAAAMFAGYATFDQWAGFVGGLLGGAA